MKNQFVSYDIALKLKELNFNEPCFGYYQDEELFYGIDLKTIKYAHKYHKEDSTILAPLWQQVIDWLNNKFNVFITLAIVGNGYGFYIHKNYNSTNKGENYGMYDTLFKAREQAILKAIELVKSGIIINNTIETQQSIILLIVQRTLAFPFFFGIAFVGAFIIFIKWIINFIRFGGESIAYTDKMDRKTIQDVFVKLSEMQQRDNN